jgi:hypothetical protein
VVPGIDIDVDQDDVADATTDSGGNYGVGNLAATVQVETLVEWDDDADGVDPDRKNAIDSWDASLIARHAVGSLTLSDNQVIAGDVSRISGVSAYDASLVSQFAVLLITHFELADDTGSDWAFVRCDNYTDASNNDCVTPCVHLHDPLMQNEVDDCYAILYGDVSGNWTLQSGSSAAVEEPPVSEFDQIRAEELRAAAIDPGVKAWLQPGADRSPSDAAELKLTGWSVPDEAGTRRRELVLEIAEGDGIQAFDLQIIFDPSKIKIVDVGTVDLTADFALLSNDHGGDYRIAMYGLLPMHGSGAVLRITVDVGPGLGRGFPLEVRAKANEVPIPVRVEGWSSLTRHPEKMRQGGR